MADGSSIISAYRLEILDDGDGCGALAGTTGSLACRSLCLGPRAPRFDTMTDILDPFPPLWSALSFFSKKMSLHPAALG